MGQKTQAALKAFLNKPEKAEQEEPKAQEEKSNKKELRGNSIFTELRKEKKTKPRSSAKKKDLDQEAKTEYENPLTAARSKQLQMMGREAVNHKNINSPLQIHLIQSESLKAAQDKIKELEEELLHLRKKNEAILSASEILKNKNESLKQNLETVDHKFNEQKKSFSEEKEVLMSALSSAKENIDKLKDKNKELDKKISGYFYNLRNRESSLEGRIEILKMENSILQREKDNKILKLKKEVENSKYKMEQLHKNHQELKSTVRSLKESSSRAVSALRATVFNLEGAKDQEDTIFTKENTAKK